MTSTCALYSTPGGMKTAAVIGVCVETEWCVNLIRVPPATATRDLTVIEAAPPENSHTRPRRGAVSARARRMPSRLHSGFMV